MDPFLIRNKEFCDELLGLWKAGEADKALDLLFQARLNSGLLLSDHVSINLLLADMGDVERHDCEKFANDALYVCEAIRRFRDTLLEKTLMSEIDISIFENLEQCARVSLAEIVQREQKATAQGKLVVKGDIAADNIPKRHDEPQCRNTIDVDALLRVIAKPGKSDKANAAGVSLDELIRKVEALYAQKEILHLDASDNQQVEGPRAGIYRLAGAIYKLIVKVGAGRLMELVKKAGGAVVDTEGTEEEASRKRQRREDDEMV